MKVLKWLLDNEATWLAMVIIAIGEMVIAVLADRMAQGLATMLHSFLPLLVAPLLRRKVTSAANVERVAEVAAASGLVPASVRT